MRSRKSIIVNCLSAACIRAGSIRLALALVLALLVVPGYVVAPVLFASLDTSAQAGQLAGTIFHAANRGILLLLVALALFWRGRCAGRLRWALLAGLLLLCGINEFILSPHMQAMKEAMGPIDALPRDDPQRTAFGLWHGVSALLHLVESLLALILTALGWRERSGSCQA